MNSDTPLTPRPHTACSIFCTTCTESSGFTTCSACLARYGLNTDTKVCTACPSNCAACTVSNSSNICTSCDSGYGLAADRLSCTGMSIRSTLIRIYYTIVLNGFHCTPLTLIGDGLYFDSVYVYLYNNVKYMYITYANYREFTYLYFYFSN